MTILYKMVNGVNIEMTPEETAARLSECTASEAEQAAIAYVGLRAAVYPSIGDQLDMLYKDKINGTNVWQDMITAVKAEFPKPEIK